MKPGALLCCTVLGIVLYGVHGVAETSAKSGKDIPPKLVTSDVRADVSSGLTSSGEPALDLLARVKQANELLYSNLQNFVCNEQMERYKGSLSGNTQRHVDTVTTKVSFESGVEHYSEIFQDRHNRASISSVAGAWSEGEFGTLLQQTQILLDTQPVVFRTVADVKGEAAAVYEVEIPAEQSPWDLEVEHRHYRIPFRTDVWVSETTGQIMQITRVSSGIPAAVGISEIRWGVTLQPVQLSEHDWLLPQTGSYEVRYAATDRREWNELTFSNYHRYGSETSLRFQ